MAARALPHSRFPRRRALRRAASCAVAAACAAALAGCEPIVTTHGYAPPEARLAEVEPGVDGAESVERKIGRPSTSGVIRANVWYYVSTTFETSGWNSPEESGRRVVAISFGPDGLVSAVDRYGMEDGRIINLVTRTTPTYGRRMTILQQIFGNLGNFEAGESGFLSN